MIRYQLVKWDNRVRTVEVVKETASFVVLPSGRREAKTSDYHEYYETAGEAWDSLVALREQQVRDAEARLEQKRAALIAAMDARSNGESSVGARQ